MIETDQGENTDDHKHHSTDCTSFVNALKDRDTTFLVISRALLAKIEAYKAQNGWSIAWVSSFRSDFNYDFHFTLDESMAPVEYNYRNKTEMKARRSKCH
jgi:predicted dithiol-disulfide oxidoreductase (DUF899 family)